MTVTLGTAQQTVVNLSKARHMEGDGTHAFNFQRLVLHGPNVLIEQYQDGQKVAEELIKPEDKDHADIMRAFRQLDVELTNILDYREYDKFVALNPEE